MQPFWPWFLSIACGLAVAHVGSLYIRNRPWDDLGEIVSSILVLIGLILFYAVNTWIVRRQQRAAAEARHQAEVARVAHLHGNPLGILGE